MSAEKRRILWVSPDDPWSQWSNSGFIARLCRELKGRGRLHGAMVPNPSSLRALRGPGPFHDLGRRLAARLGRREPARGPCDERRGKLAEVLRGLPEGSLVVYQYMYPERDPALPVERLLFQDLTVRDAVLSGAYGHAGLSGEETEARVEAQRRALAEADGVVTFSSYAARSIAADYGVPRARIAAIGAGPLRAPARVGFDRARYAAGRLLFVGRQWERKGGPLLLEAFERVRRAVPHATLTIAGAAIAPPRIEGVEHVGHVSNAEISRLFATSSLFTMPARCETWGLVYSEAAAAGLPIVGFNAWAMPDIVRDGETGVLVDEQGVDALAAQLIDLLRDPDRMLAMGRAARARMQEVLDWPHVADRLLATFLPEALEGRSPRWMDA